MAMQGWGWITIGVQNGLFPTHSSPWRTSPKLSCSWVNEVALQKSVVSSVVPRYFLCCTALLLPLHHVASSTAPYCFSGRTRNRGKMVHTVLGLNTWDIFWVFFGHVKKVTKDIGSWGRMKGPSLSIAHFDIFAKNIAKNNLSLGPLSTSSCWIRLSHQCW